MGERTSDRRGTWWRVAFAAAALALLVLALRGTDFRRTWVMLVDLGVQVFWIPLPYLAAISLDTLGWQRFLVALGSPVMFRSLLAVRMAAEAILMSLFAGTLVSETLKPYLLARRYSVPWAHGLASLAARKRFIVLTNGIYLWLAFTFGLETLRRLSGATGATLSLPALVLIAGGVLVLIATLAGEALARGRLLERLHAILGRIPFEPFRRWLGSNRGGFEDTDRAMTRSMRAPAHSWIPAAGLFLASWLLESFETYLILLLLGAPLGFADAMAIEVVLSLVRSMVFVVPAGLGVQDLGYLLFLRALGLPEASELGAAFVILKRGKELFWIAVGYLILAALGGAGRIERAAAEARP